MILIVSYNSDNVFFNVLILEVGVLLLFCSCCCCVILAILRWSLFFLQFTHTRAVVGAAGLVQVLLEHLQVQVGTRFHLQLDGEVIDHILND